MDKATSENIDEIRIQHAWRISIICLAALFMILISSYWDSYVAIVSIWWRSETFAHGFLIVPISGHLVWRKRQYLLAQMPQFALAVLLPIGLIVILWVFASAIEVQSLQHLAVVVLLPLVVWLVLGSKITSSIAFPLVFLFFAVPLGEFLIPFMQDITAAFTVSALKLTGIPVYLEGRFLHIPSGDFEVEEACSGVRYLIASVALGSLYAYLTYKSILRRMMFVMLSIAVPVVANGVRAYGIVMIAHLSNYQLAVGIDHIIYGWIFFGVIMFLLFWAGTYFREKTSSFSESNAVEIIKNNISDITKKKYIIGCVITSLALVSGPLSTSWYDQTGQRGSFIAAKLPDGKGGWDGPYGAEMEIGTVFNGATYESSAMYSKGGVKVQLYVAYYGYQEQGAELINSENKFYNHSLWHRIYEKVIEPDLSSKEEISVNEILISSSTKSRLLWYWYDVGEKMTSDRYLAKLFELESRVMGGGKGSAAVIVSTEYEGDQYEARRNLKVFMDTFLTTISGMLTGKAAG